MAQEEVIYQDFFRQKAIFEEDIDFNSIGNNNFLKKGNLIKKIDILFNKIEKEND